MLAIKRPPPPKKKKKKKGLENKIKCSESQKHENCNVQRILTLQMTQELRKARKGQA